MNQERRIDLRVEGEDFGRQLRQLVTAARRIAAAWGEPLLGEIEQQRNRAPIPRL